MMPYTFLITIAAHDSMNASLRQRRKIVELLYHDDTSENRIERHDSMVPTLRQRMLRILLRSRCSLRCPFCLADCDAHGAKRQHRFKSTRSLYHNLHKKKSSLSNTF